LGLLRWFLQDNSDITDNAYKGVHRCGGEEWWGGERSKKTPQGTVGSSYNQQNQP